jgi:hypothetical protein
MYTSDAGPHRRIKLRILYHIFLHETIVLKKVQAGWTRTSVHPEMVDFDFPMRYSGSVFATTGIVGLFRKTVNGYAIIAKKRKRSPGPKDAVSG